jgi:hypothetical protein
MSAIVARVADVVTRPGYQSRTGMTRGEASARALDTSESGIDVRVESGT